MLGDDVVVAEKPCLSQLIEQFDKYNATVLGVQKVGMDQVSKYGNKEKVISKTLKNDIKFFFNKLFKYATDMNLYDINPMQFYKVQNSSDRYLIEWDIDTLNTIFELSKGTRLHMFLHCFFGTDLKMNEILALKWDDLYIDKKNIIKI